MKYVSDSNLSRFFQKLKEIFAKKSEVPSQADVDAKLSLSGGTMTGAIKLPYNTGISSNSGETMINIANDSSNVRIGNDYRQGAGVTLLTGSAGHVYRQVGSTQYEVLDTSKGLPYTTTAPSSANTDGLKIVVLSSEPSTRYSGYLYVITS